MTTFTKRTILDLCNISSLSYCDQNEMRQKYNEKNCDVLCRCENCPILLESERNDCEVYVSEYKCDNKDNLDCLLVSFRGTSELRDVVSDLNAIRRVMDIVHERPYVHWGFYNQFMEIKSQLDSQIEQYYISNTNSPKKHTIIFSGHSLGGALATIAAVYYAKKYPNYKVHCVTFGSPRVGGYRFVKLYNKLVDASYRFVNCNDVVTMIPTRIRFRHVKGLHWLVNGGVRTSMGYRLYGSVSNTFYNWFGWGGSSSFDDHGCDEYIDKIMNNC